MSRTAARRRPARDRGIPRPSILRSARLWMFFVWLGTFAVVAYGLHQLEPYARSIKTGDMRIEWVGAPDWLQDENWRHVLPELEARIAVDPEWQPYDDRVCPYFAECLAGSSWIERVRSVTKQNDGRVKIYADFREPFAWIESGGVAYLVDSAGVRLPQQWASSVINRAGWLVISGARAAPPRLGHRWAGEDVAAGLKLARFLYRNETEKHMPFRKEVAAIDISNFRGNRDPRAGRLKLLTINPQSYIHWGLPPGEEYDIESAAELKLGMLCRLYAKEGRLPDRGPIDVRADDGIGFGEPD